MNSLVTFVQTTTWDFTPAGLRLPPIVWSAFTTMNKIHGAWRWYRRAEVYRNPANFYHLAAGHLANFVIGDNFLIRVAAQCVLIATRILECVEEQTALRKEGRTWLHAIQGHYPSPVKISWSKKQRFGWISPSTSNKWTYRAKAWIDPIQRTSIATFHIFRRTFSLSMRIMDAMDAFCFSPEVKNEGINELFVNAMKWLETLVDKKEQLLKGLVDNKLIIERILKNSPVKYEALYEATAKTLDHTEAIYNKAEKISNFGEGMLKDFGKRALSAGMVVMGIPELRPNALAHPLHPKWAS